MRHVRQRLFESGYYVDLNEEETDSVNNLLIVLGTRRLSFETSECMTTLSVLRVVILRLLQYVFFTDSGRTEKRSMQGGCNGGGGGAAVIDIFC